MTFLGSIKKPKRLKYTNSSSEIISFTKQPLAPRKYLKLLIQFITCTFFKVAVALPPAQIKVTSCKLTCGVKMSTNIHMQQRHFHSKSHLEIWNHEWPFRGICGLQGRHWQRRPKTEFLGETGAAMVPQRQLCVKLWDYGGIKIWLKKKKPWVNSGHFEKWLIQWWVVGVARGPDLVQISCK